MVVLSWSNCPRHYRLLGSLWSVPELTKLEAQVPDEDWTLKEDRDWLENGRRWRMAGAEEWQALENGRRWRMLGAGEEKGLEKERLLILAPVQI